MNETPCQLQRRRFDALHDNRRTRELCWDCWRRLGCALEAVDQIEKGLHPTGIRAGIWLPNDKRADGPNTSPARRHARDKLRSVATVLSQHK